MSAADPIRNEPDHVVPATVLAFRRPRHQSRETRVPIQPDPSSLAPELRLAASIERVFADHGRSLTDDDTAADYTITLSVFQTLLEGALEQGKLGQGEFKTLNGMIQGMLAAPRLLA